MSTVNNQFVPLALYSTCQKILSTIHVCLHCKKEVCHTCLLSDTKKRVHLQNVLRQNIRRQNVPATYVTSQLQKVPNTKPQIQKVPKTKRPTKRISYKINQASKHPNFKTSQLHRASQASKRSHRIPCTL
jgi:hypothetical protein